MNDQNVESLVMRAKAGQISAAELEAVASALEHGAGKDTYRLLYVLGRADSRRHESIVASFLDFEQDAQVAALALRLLCGDWGLGERYREYLHKFLLGEDWDIIDEVKQAAISSSGEYLRSKTDCQILGCLLKIATSGSGDLNERFAVEAIARSLGESHSSSVPDPGADGKYSVIPWEGMLGARPVAAAGCGFGSGGAVG